MGGLEALGAPGVPVVTAGAVDVCSGAEMLIKNGYLNAHYPKSNVRAGGLT